MVQREKFAALDASEQNSGKSMLYSDSHGSVEGSQVDQNRDTNVVSF